MNREERLKSCKVCLKRKMDFEQGLVCSLTGKRADFENECADFEKDEKVELRIDDTEGLAKNEIVNKLNPEVFEKIKSEQNFKKGMTFGLLAAIIGAVLWAVITVVTGFQIGYMAIAIGAGVGLAIRYFGKGIDQKFGIWGAGIALFGCLFGNILSVIGFVANAEGLGYIETFFSVDWTYIPEILVETFRPMDLVFYGIAIYEAYKFSFRLITEKGIEDLTSEK